MTEKGFAKGMSLFLATFRNIFTADTKSNKQTQKIWRELLKDISDQDFEKAIIQICREVKNIYPTTNIVALVRDQLKENQQDKIIFAWDQVLKSLKYEGHSVKFSDPIIHSCLEMMGGWEKIRDWQEKEMKWLRKEFFEIYPAMAKKGKHIEYLPGRHDTNNNFRGFNEAVKPPILVGGEENNMCKKPVRLINDVVLKSVTKKKKCDNNGVSFDCDIEIVEHKENKL